MKPRLWGIPKADRTVPGKTAAVSVKSQHLTVVFTPGAMGQTHVTLIKAQKVEKDSRILFKQGLSPDYDEVDAEVQRRGNEVHITPKSVLKPGAYALVLENTLSVWTFDVVK